MNGPRDRMGAGGSVWHLAHVHGGRNVRAAFGRGGLADSDPGGAPPSVRQTMCGYASTCPAKLLGSRASRRPSPRKLKAITAAKMNRPGIRIHG